MQFELEETPLTEALLDKFDQGFSAQAIESLGLTNRMKRRAFVSNHDGNFVGAITLSTFWGILQIRQLFIEAPYRKQGLGTLLLNRAFTVGKEENCRFAFVETMSFQALPFYQKFGFSLEFTREGYDGGAVLYYLRKAL